MSNYNDLEGFKIIAPFSAVKKPWGNGLATGSQYAKVEKVQECNTNVVWFGYDEGKKSSLQTNAINSEPISVIARISLPKLISSGQTVTVSIKDWSDDISIVKLMVYGNQQRVNSNECRAQFICGNVTKNSQILSDNYIGDITDIVIGIYHTSIKIQKETEEYEDTDCYMVGAYANGDYLGFKGWFTCCEIGWIPDYYGTTPKLEKPEITYDRTNYGGGYGGKNTNSTQGIPDLPNFSYASHGKRTYVLTAEQSSALHLFLWSNDFVDSLIKVYAQPFQTIESMYINDIYASALTPDHVKLGNVTSDVSASLTTSFVELDCGTIFYNEEYGSYLDYEPFVNIQLYLPRIGYIPLSAKDVVNNSISVKYQIDVVTGYGTAYVIVTNTRDEYTEVLTQISGAMLTAIPFSGTDNSARLSAAAGAVTNLIGGNLLGAGIDALNTHIAPSAIMKTPVSSGLLLSQKKPMLIVSRTRGVLPDTYGEDVGFMCQVSDTLRGKTGFFKIRDPHTPLINGDSWVSEEIDRLLEQGVYIK